jgi:hypothetical protein
VSNVISNDLAGAATRMSNGNTDVLLSVLLLAGSDLAETGWEVALMVRLAEHDHTVRGCGRCHSAPID